MHKAYDPVCIVHEINRQQVCWAWYTTPVRRIDCFGKGEVLDIFVEVQCTTAATVTYKSCFSSFSAKTCLFSFLVYIKPLAVDSRCCPLVQLSFSSSTLGKSQRK